MAGRPTLYGADYSVYVRIARLALMQKGFELYLSELARLGGGGAFLLGPRPTLADLHAAPVLAYFLKAEQGADLFARHSSLQLWWANVTSLPAFIATEPTA